MRKLIAVLVLLSVLSVSAFAWTKGYIGEPKICSTDYGYFIWIDKKGVWHLRTAPGGKRHTFVGRISCAEGVKIISKKGMKKEDFIERKYGSLITFYLRNNGDIRGFSFKPSDKAKKIRMTLLIDGDIAKSWDIYLGKSRINPGKNPVQLKNKK